MVGAAQQASLDDHADDTTRGSHSSKKRVDGGASSSTTTKRKRLSTSIANWLARITLNCASANSHRVAVATFRRSPKDVADIQMLIVRNNVQPGPTKKLVCNNVNLSRTHTSPPPHVQNLS